MTLYTGRVVQDGADQAKEVVVASGLCCALPFQVVRLNAVWVEIEDQYASTSGQDIRLTVQSKSGHLGLSDIGYLGGWHFNFYSDDFAKLMPVILPVQSTTGNVIVRLESTSTTVINTLDFALDLDFITLKELDYMRLKSAGY